MATKFKTKEYYHQRFTDMRNEFRRSWGPHLQEIKDNLMPWNGRHLQGNDSTETNDGGKKQSYIYDDVPQSSLGVLAGGMQSGLTSPARPWFRLATSDADLNEVPEVKQWLYEVEELMRAVFNKSNVYNATHQIYEELAGFGTAAVLIEEDAQDVIRAKVFTAGQYYLAINARRTVDVFAREFYLNTKAMVDTYGKDRVSEGVRAAWKSNSMLQLFPVVQIIEPNNDDKVKLDGFGNKPWRSVFHEPMGKTEDFLQVKGYFEFPVLTPRWATVAADVYGHSLGMRMLPDIKMLYDFQKKYLVALHKQIDPPLQAPSGMKSEQINSIPSGITYTTGAQGVGLTPLHETNVRLDFLDNKIAVTQEAIRNGFFNRLFLMLANLDRTQMTATEVAERHEEKLIMLGPVLERLHTELLDPLIDRTFGIMERAGMLPPPPEDIGGLELKVQYISILAQAQKMIGTAALEQTAAYVGNLAATDPEVLDTFNSDAAARHYADFIGTPPDVMRTPQQVAARRQERAAAQNMQQGVEMANTAAQSAKVMSEADLGGNTALSALMGAGVPGG